MRWKIIFYICPRALFSLPRYSSECFSISKKPENNPNIHVPNQKCVCVEGGQVCHHEHDSREIFLKIWTRKGMKKWSAHPLGTGDANAVKPQDSVENINCKALVFQVLVYRWGPFHNKILPLYVEMRKMRIIRKVFHNTTFIPSKESSFTLKLSFWLWCVKILFLLWSSNDGRW